MLRWEAAQALGSTLRPAATDGPPPIDEATAEPPGSDDADDEAVYTDAEDEEEALGAHAEESDGIDGSDATVVWHGAVDALVPSLAPHTTHEHTLGVRFTEAGDYVLTVECAPLATDGGGPTSSLASSLASSTGSGRSTILAATRVEHLEPYLVTHGG